MAKMLMLAVSASAALSSASARTLKQLGPNFSIAYASANQKSRAYSDENYSEGVTEADTVFSRSEAYADARGRAGYVSAPFGDGGGNFATARTEAVTSSFDVNDELVPDSQANAVSSAYSDGAAEAQAFSEASASYSVTAGSGDARSDATAEAPEVALAQAVAESFGTNNADAFGNSRARTDGNGFADTRVEAIAVGGDADSFGIAGTRSTGLDTDDDLARSDAAGYSKAERGGAASSRTQAFAISPEEAESTSTAKSVAQSYEGTGAGPATSRATASSGTPSGPPVP